MTCCDGSEGAVPTKKTRCLEMKSAMAGVMEACTLPIAAGVQVTIACRVSPTRSFARDNGSLGEAQQSVAEMSPTTPADCLGELEAWDRVMKAHGAGAGVLRVRVPVDVRGATIVTLLLHLVTTHAQGSTVAASCTSIPCLWTVVLSSHICKGIGDCLPPRTFHTAWEVELYHRPICRTRMGLIIIVVGLRPRGPSEGRNGVYVVYASVYF